MANIEFEEHQSPSQARLRAAESGVIIGKLIEYSGGLVKNARQARYVLLGFAVMMIAASLFLLVFSEQAFVEDETINKAYEAYRVSHPEAFTSE